MSEMCKDCLLQGVPAACSNCWRNEEPLEDVAPYYAHLRPEHLHGRKPGDVIYYLHAAQGVIEDAERRGVALVWGRPPKVRTK